jgi:hypothetical protein
MKNATNKTAIFRSLPFAAHEGKATKSSPELRARDFKSKYLLPKRGILLLLEQTNNNSKIYCSKIHQLQAILSARRAFSKSKIHGSNQNSSFCSFVRQTLHYKSGKFHFRCGSLENLTKRRPTSHVPAAAIFQPAALLVLNNSAQPV